jgi:hypothetical protein
MVGQGGLSSFWTLPWPSTPAGESNKREGVIMTQVTPLDVAAAKRPCEQKKARKPFRTETKVTPSNVFTAEGDGPPRPVRPFVDGREISRIEAADMRRRGVLERDLANAMRRRALHLRSGNTAAFRKADQQVDRFLDLIDLGVAMGRWEK